MEEKTTDTEEEEDLLPPEIWRLVCDYLLSEQLGRLARTSRDVRGAVRGSPAFRQLLRADEVWPEVHERSILGVAVTKEGHIVTASEDHTLKILKACASSAEPPYAPRAQNRGAASCRTTHEGHGDRVRCVCALPDGRVVSGSRDKTLIVWARDSSRLRSFGDRFFGLREQVLEGHADYVWCVVALDNDRVASGSKDATIIVWDVNTGEELQYLQGHGDSVRCLAVLPDGLLLSGSSDGLLKFWDVKYCTREFRVLATCVRTLGGAILGYTAPSSCRVTSVLVLPEGGDIVGGCEDGTLRLWPKPWDYNGFPTPYVNHRNVDHKSTIWAMVALSHERFVAVDGDGLLKIWCVSPTLDAIRPSGLYQGALTCLQTVRGHKRAVFCIAALPDGRLVTGSMDRTLRVWAPVGYQIGRARDPRT